MVTPCSKQQHYIRSGSHPAANDTLIVCTQGVHRTTSSTFVFLFLSDVTCIVVSYIGLMLVDMGKVQYCHGHTRQCTTPSRRFSSVFCTTDVKCIARSYVCRIYTGHIVLASPRALIADSTVGIRAALSPSKTPSTSTDSTTLMLPLLTCRPIPISSFRRAHVR